MKAQQDIGSWFNFIFRLRWKFTAIILVLISGFFYSLYQDWYQLDLASKIILTSIGAGFTFLAMYMDWRGIKNRQALRKD